MIIIKIGGNAISQLSPSFFHQLKQWQDAGQTVIILHGGGHLISAAADFFALPTEKIAGIRVTPAKVLQVSQNILTEVIQPHLVGLIQEHGLPCRAVNQELGPVLTATYLNQDWYGEVGQVTGVKAAGWAASAEDQVHSADRAGNQPTGTSKQKILVVNSLAQGPDGQVLNVNADTAAQALASHFHAKELILLTDVPGVLVNDQIIDQLAWPTAENLITQGMITGGMVPKIKAAFAALEQGIQTITITNQLGQGTQLHR